MQRTAAGINKEAARNVEILDQDQQELLINRLRKRIQDTGKVGNFCAGLLLLVACIWFLISHVQGTLARLPPLSPLVSIFILETSLLSSAFLSFRPTFFPFAINHLETGGPSLILSLLALTSPTVSAKLVWFAPVLLIVIAYEMRRDVENLSKELAELERKMYSSPTA